MTVLRRINGERVVILGWPRAILMQIAHPLIAAGVAQHSSFRGGASEAAVRLHHTVSAMLSLTFGDRPRREAALERIRTIHRSVHGVLREPAGPFPAGTPYSAEDPALLLWVHLTLLDSNAEMYQRLVAPLSNEDLDALCAESAPLLAELGGDDAGAPRTWRAMREEMERIERSGVLVVSAEARAVADGVMSPRSGEMRVPFTGWQRLITIGLLPPFLRDAYGFTWNEKRDARFERTMGILRGTRRATPDAVARWRDARRPPPEV